MGYKLLQISAAVNTTGPGRIAEEIGCRAIAAGFDSYIAFGRIARESHSSVIKIGSKWSVRRHGLASRIFDAHGFASRQATRKLIDQIEEIKPDVILLHNLHGYYLNIDILLTFLKDKDIPLFWTLHDCWLFTGHCTYFDAYECDKWKTHCEHCPNRMGYPKSLFLDRSKRNYDKKKSLLKALRNVTFIPVCQWMGRVVNESFMKDTPQRVIYNGVNIEVFRPQNAVMKEMMRSKYGIPDKPIIMGVASIWDKRKGLEDFEWLKNRLPNDYQIVLIGLTSGQAMRLSGGIICIPRTENVQELAALYSLANVFVNPTYVDNFPTTNIEALACGTPVITYNTGGSPEAIDENTGVLVPKGDKEALIQAIIQVMTCQNRYSSEDCRRRAVEHFNQDDRYGDYIALFNQAISRGI